jgi:hypothetical protein
LGKPDLKKQTFILITDSFPGFGMDMHPEVENDDSSFPDANPPSKSEKWNDPNLNLILQSNDVHEDCRFPTDCLHEKV